MFSCSTHPGPLLTYQNTRERNILGILTPPPNCTTGPSGVFAPSTGAVVLGTSLLCLSEALAALRCVNTSLDTRCVSHCAYCIPSPVYQPELQGRGLSEDDFCFNFPSCFPPPLISDLSLFCMCLSRSLRELRKSIRVWAALYFM